MKGLDCIPLYLFGDINNESVKPIIEALDTNRTINVLFLNTAGGNVCAALALVDCLKRHTKVTVVATGECCSAGVTILMAAAKRQATENTRFLVHKVRAFKGCDCEPTPQNDREIALLNKLLVDSFSATTKFTTEESVKFIDNAEFFGSKYALEMGLVQKIY